MTILVVGGSGFIGSHICERFGAHPYDLQQGYDARDLGQLCSVMRHYDTVIHLASNPDVAAGAEDPTLDFREGTILTQNVCEAARLTGVQRIIYASGSGVYGDDGFWFHEDRMLKPCSPYGASKAAGEALVSAYCHMFNMRGIALRFANVVGPGQTHGVGYDFMRKLRFKSGELVILGDGNQTKSYVAVSDVLDAIEIVMEKQRLPFEVYNVASRDTLSVREIADMVCERLNVSPTYFFTGGAVGWPGDVPFIRLTTMKLRQLGWTPKMSSREAMQWALESM